MDKFSVMYQTNGDSCEYSVFITVCERTKRFTKVYQCKLGCGYLIEIIIIMLLSGSYPNNARPYNSDALNITVTGDIR